MFNFGIKNDLTVPGNGPVISYCFFRYTNVFLRYFYFGYTSNPPFGKKRMLLMRSPAKN